MANPNFSGSLISDKADFNGDLPGVVHYGIQGPQGPVGPQGPTGPAGDDYVLTDADKAEIAEMAADLVEVPEHSGGNVDLEGYATEQYVKGYAQPKGDYLTAQDYPQIAEYVISNLPVYNGEVVPV